MMKLIIYNAHIYCSLMFSNVYLYACYMKFRMFTCNADQTVIIL